MKADYFRVEPTFWTGPTGRKIRGLGLEARVVATYLLTGSTASPLGLYYLPVPLMVHETGIPLEGASKALRSLAAIEFAHYDDEAEVVWVPEMARIQIGPSLGAADNRVKWVNQEVRRIHRLPFFPAFIHRYGDAFHVKLPEGYPPKPLEPHRNGSPTEGGSKALGSQPQPQPQLQHQGEKAAPMPPTSPPPGVRVPARPGVQLTHCPDGLPEQEARVRRTFDAIAIGLNLRLTYNQRYVAGVQRVLDCNPANVGEVTAVAAHYAAGLEPPARVSWDRFTEKYDERRAQWEADQDGSGKGGVPGALWTKADGPLCDQHRSAPAGCRLCMTCAENQPEQNRTASYWLRKDGGRRG